MDFLALYKEERARARAQQQQQQRPLQDRPVRSQASTEPPAEATAASAKPQQAAGTAGAASPVTFPPFSLSTGTASLPPVDLEAHKTGGVSTVYYVPDFLSPQLEQEILAQVYAVPDSHPRWTQLRTRRLQCWGGQLSNTTTAHDPTDLAPWLQRLCRVLVECGVFPPHAPPNHVLINEYRPGQGIMPHTDGPLYYPRTATISLGSDAVFKLAPRPCASGDTRAVNLGPREALLLRRCCLVVFTDAAYAGYTHGIDFVSEERVRGSGVAGSGSGDGACVVANAAVAGVPEGGEVAVTRGVRVSLTLRHVPSSSGAALQASAVAAELGPQQPPPGAALPP